jgi:hypothetical protein
LVCAEDRRVAGFQAAEHVGVGVAEGVFVAYGDDGDGGGDDVEEGLGGGCS